MSSKLVVASSLVGGAVGARYLRDFCMIVDETNPNTALGETFMATEKAVKATLETTKMLKTKCDESDSYQAVMGVGKAVGKATSTVWDSLLSTVSEAWTSDSVDERPEDRDKKEL